MADIFTKKQALKLLKKKFILLMGDSNTRALYNDLIHLLHENDVVQPIVLRKHTAKGGCSKLDIDRIVRRTQVTDATRHIQEVREFVASGAVVVRFCFVTRALGDQVQRQLQEIENGEVAKPDIVIMNSCVWDIMRWGAMQEATYRQQLVRLFTRLRALLPPEALVIWNTALPVAETKVRGGYVIKQLEFIQKNMRFIALEANQFAAELCKLFCFDLVDLHYHMRFQLARRCADGIHWEPHAVRHLTCVLLTHIALSFEQPLANNLPSCYLSAAVDAAAEQRNLQQVSVQLGRQVLECVQRELEAALRGGGQPTSQLDQQDGDQQKRRKRRIRRFNQPSTSGANSVHSSRQSPSAASNTATAARTSALQRLDDIVINVHHSSSNRTKMNQGDGDNLHIFGESDVNNNKVPNPLQEPPPEDPPAPRRLASTVTCMSSSTTGRGLRLIRNRVRGLSRSSTLVNNTSSTPVSNTSSTNSSSSRLSRNESRSSSLNRGSGCSDDRVWTADAAAERRRSQSANRSGAGPMRHHVPRASAISTATAAGSVGIAARLAPLRSSCPDLSRSSNNVAGNSSVELGLLGRNPSPPNGGSHSISPLFHQLEGYYPSSHHGGYRYTALNYRGGGNHWQGRSQDVYQYASPLNTQQIALGNNPAQLFPNTRQTFHSVDGQSYNDHSHAFNSQLVFRPSGASGTDRFDSSYSYSRNRSGR